MLGHVCVAAALVSVLAAPSASADARGSMLPPDRFLHASVGAVGALGFAPRANPGFTAALGYRTDRYALDLEGRRDLQATANGATSSLFSISFVPCILRGPLGLCAIAGSGARYGESSWRFWMAVGGRVAVDLPIVSTLTVGMHLDGLIPLFRLTPGDGFKPSPIGGAVGLRIGMSFE